MITNEQKNRITNFGRLVWGQLTSEERENYYFDDGTIGFVEDLLKILHIDPNNLTTEEFEDIHDNVCWENRPKVEIYGIYQPNYDMTFIMEEVYNDKDEPISLEVKGFYYGEPNDRDNDTFYNDLRADMEV